VALALGVRIPPLPPMDIGTEKLANKLDFLAEVLEESVYSEMGRGLRCAADRLRELEDQLNPGDVPDYTLKGRLEAAELEVASLRAAISEHKRTLVRMGEFDGVDQALWSLLESDKNV
jgi:hypothetical protein